MNAPAKTIGIALLALIGIYVVWHLVFGIVGFFTHLLFSVVLPIAVVGAIGYGIYRVVRPKALGSNRRLLP